MEVPGPSCLHLRRARPDKAVPLVRCPDCGTIFLEPQGEQSATELLLNESERAKPKSMEDTVFEWLLQDQEAATKLVNAAVQAQQLSKQAAFKPAV